MAQEDNKTRLPKLQYDKLLEEGGFDNRDKLEQDPSGRLRWKRSISEQETCGESDGSGSYWEKRGYPDPKTGEINAGGTVEFIADNRCVYVKGGTSDTYDNNWDWKPGGFERGNVGPAGGDGHKTYSKHNSYVMGNHLEIHAQGNLKLSAGGDVLVATRKGTINLAAARDIEMNANEGRVMARSTGVNYDYTETASPQGGDKHIETARKFKVNGKDNFEFDGEKNWNTNFKEEIYHKAQKEYNHETQSDHFIVVPSAFSWIGQESKSQRSGAFVLTVAGPAKKAKALV